MALGSTWDVLLRGAFACRACLAWHSYFSPAVKTKSKAFALAVIYLHGGTQRALSTAEQGARPSVLSHTVDKLISQLRCKIHVSFPLTCSVLHSARKAAASRVPSRPLLNPYPIIGR